MKQLFHMIGPVSLERVDENVERVIALGVLLLLGVYFVSGTAWIPALLLVDFFIRAYAKRKLSPLGYLSRLFVRMMDTREILILMAPKVFAARVGFLFISLTTIGAFLNWPLLAYISGTTLILFAFLESGFNFCMFCWIYTLLGYPLFGKNKA